MVGLRYSLGIAWLALVFAEQVNASNLMANGEQLFQTDVIVVCLVIYAILGLLTDLIVGFRDQTPAELAHRINRRIMTPTTATPAAVTVGQLSRTFGRRAVISNLNLEIGAGEFVGLTRGPARAGPTADVSAYRASATASPPRS